MGIPKSNTLVDFKSRNLKKYKCYKSETDLVIFILALDIYHCGYLQTKPEKMYPLLFELLEICNKWTFKYDHLLVCVGNLSMIQCPSLATPEKKSGHPPGQI